MRILSCQGRCIPAAVLLSELPGYHLVPVSAPSLHFVPSPTLLQSHSAHCAFSSIAACSQPTMSDSLTWYMPGWILHYWNHMRPESRDDVAIVLLPADTDLTGRCPGWKIETSKLHVAINIWWQRRITKKRIVRWTTRTNESALSKRSANLIEACAYTDVQSLQRGTVFVPEDPVPSLTLQRSIYEEAICTWR